MISAALSCPVYVPSGEVRGLLSRTAAGKLSLEGNANGHDQDGLRTINELEKFKVQFVSVVKPFCNETHPTSWNSL